MKTICLFVTAFLVVSTCSASFDERIVGGSPISIEQAPWQLSLELYEVHVCGAAIVDESWAVTSATCAQRANNDTELIRLRSGSSLFGQGGVLHNVSLIEIHPQYQFTSLNYDLALIKVVQPFESDPLTAVIPLATEEPPVGTIVAMTGWGKTHSEYPVITEQLHQVEVPIVDTDRCDLQYQVFGGVGNVSFCAGPDGGGRDACDGDFGGPAVAGGKLVGVASWGKGCGQRGYPGVYGSIAIMKDWISEVTGAFVMGVDQTNKIL